MKINNTRKQEQIGWYYNYVIQSACSYDVYS